MIVLIALLGRKLASFCGDFQLISTVCNGVSSLDVANLALGTVRAVTEIARS